MTSHSDRATAPENQPDIPISALLLRVLIDIAFMQPDPDERAAMIDILRKDGWIEGGAA